MLRNDPDDWNQSDAVGLRTYIASNPKFLRYLARQRPKIKGSTMEHRAVTGSEANGFNLAVEEIEAMQLDTQRTHDSTRFITGEGEES